MSKAFSEIDELAFRLRSLQPMKEEYQKRLDKKFRLEFNYNSNHIEGNTLTYSHTEMLLIFDKVTGDYNAREIEEMKAHDLALQMIRQQAQDKARDLTENFIRELNEVILVRPFYKEAITPDGQETRRLIEPGKYKEFPNSVRLANGEIFDYASPAETPALMNQLMLSYRDHQKEHPLWQAATLHYDFVRIHPFDDGNGRVARLLMNYVLLKHDLPPVIIRSSDKKNYITALNKADTGDKDAFVKYIEDQLKWSLEISIKAAQGENIDEVDDLDKEIELLKVKLDGTKPNKSPKLIYSAYLTVEKNCWGPLNESLKTFNKLFNETKIVHSVNGHDELYETKTTNIIFGDFIKETSSEPKKVKIFGHDIYDEYTDIKYIRWQETKYSLRGTSKIINCIVELRVDFGINDYRMCVSINRTDVYEIKKSYTEVISDHEIQDMITNTKRYLNDFIHDALKISE